MSDTLRYVVQEGAPARVAGRRVQPSDVLSLSSQAAEYERDLGYLRLEAVGPAELEAVGPAELEAVSLAELVDLSPTHDE